MATAEMKKDGTARAGLDVGWSIVTNEEFELVGWVGLPHEMVEFAFRERFMGRENEVAIVKR